MTNAVYSMTVRALSGVVSDRAAEMMLRAVLRDQGYAPESVTAGEMQSLLSGPLLERLTLAMPPVQARQTLQRLSAQLAAQYPKAPTLFLEQQPVAAWDDAPEMTGILAKTACGALEHIPVAYETNLSRALETLQEHHYTVIGLDEHSDKTFVSLPAYDRAVIVLGAEGPGIRRLVREHCDVLVKLPTQEPIASLNVSNAAAVALYALTA